MVAVDEPRNNYSADGIHVLGGERMDNCEMDLDLDLGQLDLAASERLKDLFLTAASQARSYDDEACEHFLTGLASLMETLQRAQWPQAFERLKNA